MRIVATCAALAVLVGGATRAARAQKSDVSEERQMTLPTGRVLVQALAEINLSEDAVAEPFSLAPDVWYGVSDVLTIGLVNSGRGATGLVGGVGDGICLSGSDGGCAKVYDSLGVDGRYHFYREGGMTMAADGGLFARSFDPFQLALKIGGVGRWQTARRAVELAPSLFFGLTQREPDATMATAAGPNKEIFTLPVTGVYAFSPRFGLLGQLGLVIPFESTGDTFRVPVSVGVQYWVSEAFFTDAAFSLPALLGGQLVDDGTDNRTVTIGVGYAR